MIQLKKYQRVDWFALTGDLSKNGISLYDVERITGVPRSTVQGWRTEISRPRIRESAIKVINLWADVTSNDVKDVPVVNDN